MPSRFCYSLDRYGTNFEATSSMSCSEQYFHFPPLFLSFATSFPWYTAIPRLSQLVQGLLWHDLGMTYCTPRSPVEKMSVLFKPKHANISTDHLPRPRTATSFCSTSSSDASMSIFAVSSPLTNFSARPWIYSAFLAERPAVRRCARSVFTTSSGVGYVPGVPSSF